MHLIHEQHFESCWFKLIRVLKWSNSQKSNTQLNLILSIGTIYFYQTIGNLDHREIFLNKKAKQISPSLQWMNLKIYSYASKVHIHKLWLFSDRVEFKSVWFKQKWTLTQSYTHTCTHIYTRHCLPRLLALLLSHKHGRRHKAVPVDDIGALVTVLGVTVCAHIWRRDLVASGIIPARGGSRVIMRPLLIVMVGIQVLPEIR